MKKLIRTKSLAIIVSSIILVIAILVTAQSYFSYLEVKKLTDECYDTGGLPKIEKSGFSIEHFSCNKD